ncbi:MAG: aminoacyl-tRNA hydrolase [Oscillospiraceae bacterium]|nr:aminoacyl-tRNA hydrolase [Oscillospiraceae bacterium]
MFGRKEESWLIVGLGNPGKDYERTRHNAGFRALDLLSAKLGCKVDKGKFQGLYGQTAYAGKKLYLLKPLTYMNLSGRSVLQLSAYYKIPPQRIIVLFDDISLEPGRLRIRAEGSAGGHNGIKSIIAELGSQDFPRIKIGVGAKPHEQQDLADWVLSSFSASEEKDLASALARGAEAALCIIDHGVPEAANRYNGSQP